MEDYRLKQGATPVAYRLYLIPEETNQKVLGRVEIDLDVSMADSVLEVNSRDLSFSSVSLSRADGTTLQGRWIQDETREIARIEFNGRFGAGAWQLAIEYEGRINDQLLGLYRSSWETEEGGKEIILSTHFEPVHARSVFPCFDEPSFKTVYSISILADQDLRCVSNEALKDRSSESCASNEHPFFSGVQKDNHKIFAFESTVPISSYLVAFVLGPIHSSEPVMVNGIEVRVWSRLADSQKRQRLSEFALNSASFALQFYEEYFEIKYPGNKIDLVALPDFPIGAMENMGCITFREDALLIDLQTATRSNLVRVAEIVMHELAHMWFGNLVTMSWWNGLWLKESFATFMANLCLDAWKPDWHVWTSFATTRLAAMSLDSLKSTHPIECPVGHPDEATEMFDMISYNKGCSILYQLHELIGAETFRKGCALYLDRYQGGCTETEYLWDALAEACAASKTPHPVSKMMDDWVFQEGHPILKVKETDSENFLDVEQKRFSITPAVGTEDNTNWIIPLFLRAHYQDIASNKYLTISNQRERLFISAHNEHYTLNADGAGFYRVVYSESIYREIEEKLFTHISHIERFNLLNDLWMDCLAGEHSPEVFLKLLQKYDQETEPQIWLFIQSVCQQLRRLIGASPKAKEGFERYIGNLAGVNLKKLGFTTRDDDSQVAKELRAVTLSISGNLANEQRTKEKARNLFDQILSQTLESELDPELKAELVKLVAHDGDPALYEQFISLAGSADTPQESSRYIYALSQFQDRSLAERTLAHCLDKTVRSQDAPFLISRILNSPANADLAWAFIKDNFDHIKAHWPPISVRKMCSQLMHLDDNETAEDIETFFKDNPLPAGSRAIQQMLESLRANQRFRRENRAVLENYFMTS